MVTRREAAEKVASRLRMNVVVLYLIFVAAEALIGWFIIDGLLDHKYHLSYFAILAVVLTVTIISETVYDKIGEPDAPRRHVRRAGP